MQKPIFAGKHIFLLIILAGATAFLLNYFPIPVPFMPKPEKISTLQVGEKRITVEIADSNELRERGLSGKLSLPQDHGMLFVFDNPDIYRFWMPNMRFGIDIIWIAGGEVIGITEYALPETDLKNPRFYMPPGPIDHALEVNAGFAKEHGIKVGDLIIFPCIRPLTYCTP